MKDDVSEAKHVTKQSDTVGACFSASYSEARDRFIAATRSAGADVASYVHTRQAGPAGDPLAMDVARFGPTDAKRLAFFTCGTHGLEAAAGAATYLQWVSSGGPQTLSADVAVVLVHAVNPYGWAHRQRGDEDNVDINRNCFDRSSIGPVNEAYRDLHGLMVSEDVSDASLERSIAAFRTYCESHGASRGFQGLTAGQYEYPDGLSYGGAEASWSYRTLQNVIRDLGCNAKKVVAVDWHTGIGTYGNPFIIVSAADGGDPIVRASECWGSDYVHSDDIYDSGAVAHHTGLVMTAVEAAFRQQGASDVLSAVIEWGTFDIDTMFKALLIDRYLVSHGSLDTNNEQAAVRDTVIERFCPTDQIWRRAVLHHSARIYRQVLAYLSD